MHAVLGCVALGCLCLLLSVVPASAQSTQNGTTSPSNSKTPAKHYHHHHHAKPTPAVVAPTPPPPPAPLPPADQTPHPATVSYARGVLQVKADNSSLVQTLNQISQKSGLAIEGLTHDQRIYGQYGPGPLTDTVTKLLDGAGYDYIIVGGNGKTPGKLILTQPGTGGSTANLNPAPTATQPAAKPQTPENPEMTDPTQPPQPKSPQEIFDELKRMHPQPH